MKLQADMFRAGQREGTIVAGDPAVVARLFSAMVSAFQSTDLGVGSMTVGEFHDFLEGAFGARGS